MIGLSKQYLNILNKFNEYEAYSQKNEKSLTSSLQKYHFNHF